MKETYFTSFGKVASFCRFAVPAVIIAGAFVRCFLEGGNYSDIIINAGIALACFLTLDFFTTYCKKYDEDHAPHDEGIE